MTGKPQDQILRSHTHDYRSACIYLLTVTVEGRRPLLGQLAGDVQTARIDLTPLGEAVRYELYALCRRYPQLKLLQFQIMPDHVHVILQVTERLSKPLGSLLSAWKIACGHAYARLSPISGASAGAHNKGNGGFLLATDSGVAAPLSGAGALAPPEREPFRRLFAEGYNDRILQGPSQLQHMIDYVRDNPRRLFLKRANNPYFTIHRDVDIAGHTFDAIGNLALLRAPLLAVHCRRHWTAAEQQAFADRCREATGRGAVLIGVFISKAEQAIAQQAAERHSPIIHLTENGLTDMYKPTGRAFYACAEGRLLQLTPWPYHTGRKAISREQCNTLNTLAETIAILVHATP